MVSTRRTSARLQEKQGSASVPSSPTPSLTPSSPAMRKSRSATKATPPSTTRQRKATPTKSTGSGAKRGRPARAAKADKSGSSESDDANATQSDTASEKDNGSAAEENEPEVKKQLFADEEQQAQVDEQKPEVSDEQVEVEVVEEVVVVEELAPIVEAPEEEEPEQDEQQVQKQQEAAEEDEEEEEAEEIVMMDDSEEEDAAEDNARDEEGDDEEDELDMAEFAKMAASGINLSMASSAKTAASTPATKSGFNLVPDTLDSGASSRTKFLEFEGTKLALGAKIVADTASAEEQKVLAQQLGKVEKANRQRAESKSVGSAGRKWFDMATHEMDGDARRDFALLKMRNYLDPKKFYKTSDHNKKMPKHFQFGTVIEGAHEFKSARLTKKERKQTFTEEIMADEGIRKYTKRVFLQVQDKRAGQGNKKKQKTKARF